MIRTRRTDKRYATRIDVHPEFLNDPISGEYLRKESLKKLKVPKNTLRIIFLNKETGWHGNGFVKNIKAVIFTYNIITFKR